VTGISRAALDECLADEGAGVRRRGDAPERNGLVRVAELCLPVLELPTQEVGVAAPEQVSGRGEDRAPAVPVLADRIEDGARLGTIREGKRDRGDDPEEAAVRGDQVAVRERPEREVGDLRGRAAVERPAVRRNRGKHACAYPLPLPLGAVAAEALTETVLVAGTPEERQELKGLKPLSEVVLGPPYDRRGLVGVTREQHRADQTVRSLRALDRVGERLEGGTQVGAARRGVSEDLGQPELRQHAGAQVWPRGLLERT
jgi:hypothetical protein